MCKKKIPQEHSFNEGEVADGMINCQGCGIPCKDKSRSCWVKFGMCIRCAVKNYPSEFSYKVIARYSKIAPDRINPKYKICEDCHNVMSKLRYWKNSTTVSLNTFYCVQCRVIINYDNKIKFTQPMEVKN